MIYSRIPQSVSSSWKDEIGLDDEDSAAVLAWMQKQGGR